MLGTKEKGIMLYIIDHCERIEEKIISISKQEFDKSKDIQEIVCFNIFQIGELAKNLSMDFIDHYNAVPWSQIKGMRDKIGHGYGTIEMDRVWNTAINDIKPLREYCQQIVDDNK